MGTLLDTGLIRGVLTLIVFSAFMILVFWAYSGRRRADFDAASQLPLQPDAPLDADTAKTPPAATKEETRHE